MNIFGGTAVEPSIIEFFTQFGIDKENTAGLAVSIAAGNCVVGGTVQIVNPTLLELTDNTLNFIVLDTVAGTVTLDVGAVVSPHVQLYKLVTLNGQIVSCTDLRLVYYATANGITPGAPAGITYLPWVIKTGTYTAVNGDNILLDSRSTPFNILLPAGTPNAVINLKDYANSLGTNNVTLIPNGTDLIEGGAVNYLLNTDNQTLGLLFVDNTVGWKVFSETTLPTVSESLPAPPGTSTVNIVFTTANGLVVSGSPVLGSGTVALSIAPGGIANTSLANSSITVAGHVVALGGSTAINYADLATGAPLATASVAGIVRPDNTTIQVSAGVLTVIGGGGGGADNYSATAFTSQTSITVTHNFGRYPVVSVLDNSGHRLYPDDELHNSVNQFTVIFSSSTSGTIIARG